MSTETNDQPAGQLNATAIAEIVGSAVKTALETIKSQISQEQVEETKELEKDDGKISEPVQHYLQHLDDMKQGMHTGKELSGSDVVPQKTENQSLTGKSI